jgi:hypothetical protein
MAVHEFGKEEVCEPELLEGKPFGGFQLICEMPEAAGPARPFILAADECSPQDGSCSSRTGNVSFMPSSGAKLRLAAGAHLDGKSLPVGVRKLKA